MQLFVIRRRNGWATAEDLQAAAARSTAEGDKPGSGVRWIRSYVVGEDNGDLGTVCIYEAESPEAIRTHAGRVGMPADEITPVGDTVIVRPDPVAVTG
jgi:sporulation protein YlmC with PRC-barrel domain